MDPGAKNGSCDVDRRFCSRADGVVGTAMDAFDIRIGIASLRCIYPGDRAPVARTLPTAAQIRQAFLSLPFAKPSVGMQPVNNRTLVNLSNYYWATWPSGAGLTPNQISKPVTLIGHSVEFKIRVNSYVYDFGDGTKSAPTTDPGAVRAKGGQIRHTYKKTGVMPVSVQTTLTADYRINGGAWVPIDGLADLQNEPVTNINVLEARAVLVN